MNTFQYSQIQNLPRCCPKYCKPVAPNKCKVFLKGSHFTVAGTTPTPWRRAPVFVMKDATQLPMTKQEPNGVPSGPNSLRSQGLYSFLLLLSKKNFRLHVRQLYVLPNFDCLLTLHLSIILVINQHNAQNLVLY